MLMIFTRTHPVTWRSLPIHSRGRGYSSLASCIQADEMSWRPWTQSAKRVKYMKGVKRKFPEPIKKWNIVRGDTVSVDF